jgi:2-methylcitrate dehydratase PrpD
MRNRYFLAESTAERLACSLTGLSYADLPQATLSAAKRCTLDAIACAAAGFRHQAVRAASAWAISAFRDGRSSVWFTGESVSSFAAAFANAFAASILDVDDGHRAALGHPGAAIIPAVLAEADSLEATAEAMLLAIVCGYEAAVGVARSREPANLSVVATGRWSAIGVAAAVGKLRGLSSSHLRQALTIAESHSPNLASADHAGFLGGDVKEGIPWSVIAGIAAVDLAQGGMRGYDSALDNPAMYRPGLAVPPPGSPLLIESTYFKRYACCRWIHSAIDAIFSMGTRPVPSGQIEAIEVSTFGRAAALKNPVRPQDVIAAQFSVPFAVALAYELGPDALLPIAESTLTDERIVRLAAKIRVSVDEELEAAYPAQVPARVKILANGKTVEREIRVPKGDPGNPLTDADLTEKAVRLTKGTWTESTTRALASRLLSPMGFSSASLRAQLMQRQ